MPTKYQTTNEKVKDFVEDFIYPKLLLKEANYNKVIQTICVETGASKPKVIEFLNQLDGLQMIEILVQAGENLLEKKKEKEQKIEEEIEEVLGK